MESFQQLGQNKTNYRPILFSILKKLTELNKHFLKDFMSSY